MWWLRRSNGWNCQQGMNMDRKGSSLPQRSLWPRNVNDQVICSLDCIRLFHVFPSGLKGTRIFGNVTWSAGKLEASLSSSAAERERTAPMTFVMPTTRGLSLLKSRKPRLYFPYHNYLVRRD